VPLTIPTLDNSSYQDILNEAVARIPVYTPEWTNFNKSDPGVTILEIFAFLNENLLFVANQVPEQNRLKFLTLLGLGLQPAASSAGLVQISNNNGPLETITLNSGITVSAGTVPFQLSLGLDVLPVTAQIYSKQQASTLTTQAQAYYAQLYASMGMQPQNLAFYQAVQFTGDTPVDLSTTVDSRLWIALIARNGDSVDVARQQLGGAVLSLGIVPSVNAPSPAATAAASNGSSATTATTGTTTTTGTSAATATNSTTATSGTNAVDIPPGAPANASSPAPMTFETPVATSATPAWRSCNAMFIANLAAEPGVVQVTLPSADLL
jgi:hypothetical protein